MPNRDRPASHARALLAARPRAGPAFADIAVGRHRLGLGGSREGAALVPAGLRPGRSAPLVVSLHGAGGVAAHAIDLLAPYAERDGFIVLAPTSAGPTWDVIRGGYGPDVAQIDRGLDAALGLAPIDGRRIAISGFSDGASYALSLGLANGGLFSDILAFSPGFMAPPATSGHPRIFISHGARDHVLPIERCGRPLSRALKGAGYDLDYCEFDGPHTVPPATIERALARFLA